MPCPADLAYGGICLRARNAVPGTAIVYTSSCLRAYYAMFGTEIERAAICRRAMRRLVLTPRMALPGASFHL
eukprot:1600921-Rhodomonas_salina.2